MLHSEKVQSAVSDDDVQIHFKSTLLFWIQMLIPYFI